jgi:crotonobetainyl-CoA:carnitine CoA-transferase CaiB-like acyl-CoA transferase
VTSIAVEKSQAEIRGLLRRFIDGGYRIEERKSADGTEHAALAFSNGQHEVRFVAEIDPPDYDAVSVLARRARTRTRAEIEDELREAHRRETWHGLAQAIKARLRSVDVGVQTFEEAFLANIVVDTDTGETVYQRMSTQLALPAPAAGA